MIVLQYLILISTDFMISFLCFILRFNFDWEDISKHLKVCLKYSVKHDIFSSLLSF